MSAYSAAWTNYPFCLQSSLAQIPAPFFRTIATCDLMDLDNDLYRIDSDEEINGPPPVKRRKPLVIPLDQSNWVWHYIPSPCSELVWRLATDDLVDKFSDLLLRNFPLQTSILLPSSLFADDIPKIPKSGLPLNIRWKLEANDLRHNGTAMLSSKKYKIFLNIKREFKRVPRPEI